MRQLWRAVFWAGIALWALFAIAYVLSVPFYSGAGWSWGRWRMEHGRLTVALTPSPQHESFYVAINSEGLRFGPEMRIRSWNDASVTAPLWMGLLFAGGLAAVARRRHRHARQRAGRDVCRRCGHSLAGLGRSPITCPECGTHGRDR
jgi:hypothetical protein